MNPAPDQSANRAEAFIARWQGREGGQERANYVSFLKELCEAFDLGQPDPADATHERNDYVFERAVTRHRDEGDTIGRIDLYKKNSFVLEAKQSRWKGGGKEIAGQNDLFSAEDEPAERGKRGASRAWDVLMLNAKRQAEEYARALPTSHGWPPFILVCDVGHCIEVYSDFSGQGKNYTQFPTGRTFESISKTCASRRCVIAFNASGKLRRHSIQRARRRRLRATSPNGWPRFQRHWRPRNIPPRRSRIS
jgi:hypothetical protein